MSTVALREKDWPRVTGFDFIDEPLHGYNETPGASVQRRIGLAALVGLGILLTGMGSFVVRNFTGPIPFKGIPDIRPVFFFLSGFLFTLTASWGPAARRRLALWSVTAFILGFHLEEATVHWIGPYPGSITGSRVGLVGTAGSLLALVGVLLLHIEVESEHLRRDAVKRGASDDGAASLADGLRRAGSRRVWGIAGGVAGIGVLVAAMEPILGNGGAGGGWVLLAGAGLLLGLAAYLLRLVPGGKT